MSGLCLAAGALTAILGTDAATLSWTHSVEKVEWQEDYRAVDGTLRVEAARIRGSGAGMEPPADAVLRDGWWTFEPQMARLPALLLAQSGAAGDYRLCWAGKCSTPSALLPDAGSAPRFELRPCPDE